MREVRADAPGRVNLIGEHTDYHDGYVMPCAVPQRAYVELRRRDNPNVRLSSSEMPDPFEYRVGSEQRRSTWGDYIQGLTWILQQRGCALTGFELHLHSEVPVGSGLSSSAAIQVATLRALREAFSLELDDVELARIAQRAEVEFVGAPVGIMDQMAASLADERSALFLDTRTLAFEAIPLPDTLELAVLDSGVRHQHADGGYRTRRQESEEAARMLGVDRLRDAPSGSLERLAMFPPLLARRARHVITENVRVLQARESLLRNDMQQLGILFNASHASLRDDYQVSVPAVDLLVDLAQQEPRVFGARMTGGGFGGAVVIAAAAGGAAAVAASVADAFAARMDTPATILVPQLSR